ncbi:hypothetical protein ACTXT7_014426, partial [Hymenolepis weldensis]
VPSNTHAQFSSKDTVQPHTPSVQSSLQDTVKSTTPNSCMSRAELSRTRCGRRVNFPSRPADYEESTVRVHNTNKADRIACARTGWEVQYVTGRVEDKCRRACKDLLSQSTINIPAAWHGFVFND